MNSPSEGLHLLQRLPVQATLWNAVILCSVKQGISYHSALSDRVIPEGCGNSLAYLEVEANAHIAQKGKYHQEMSIRISVLLSRTILEPQDKMLQLSLWFKELRLCLVFVPVSHMLLRCAFYGFPHWTLRSTSPTTSQFLLPSELGERKLDINDAILFPPTPQITTVSSSKILLLFQRESILLT